MESLPPPPADFLINIQFAEQYMLRGDYVASLNLLKTAFANAHVDIGADPFICTLICHSIIPAFSRDRVHFVKFIDEMLPVFQRAIPEQYFVVIMVLVKYSVECQDGLYALILLDELLTLRLQTNSPIVFALDLKDILRVCEDFFMSREQEGRPCAQFLMLKALNAYWQQVNNITLPNLLPVQNFIDQSQRSAVLPEAAEFVASVTTKINELREKENSAELDASWLPSTTQSSGKATAQRKRSKSKKKRRERLNSTATNNGEEAAASAVPDPEESTATKRKKKRKKKKSGGQASSPSHSQTTENGVCDDAVDDGENSNGDESVPSSPSQSSDAGAAGILEEFVGNDLNHSSPPFRPWISPQELLNNDAFNQPEILNVVEGLEDSNDDFQPVRSRNRPARPNIQPTPNGHGSRNDDDDDDFISIGSRGRPVKPPQRYRPLISGGAEDEDDVVEEVNGQIDVWKRYGYLSCSKEMLLDKLYKLNLYIDLIAAPNGSISSAGDNPLLSVLWHHYQNKRFKLHHLGNEEELRTLLHTQIEEQQKEVTDDNLLATVASTFDVEVRVISSCPLFQDIIFVANGPRRPRVYLAHIQGNTFASLATPGVSVCDNPVDNIPNEHFEISSSLTRENTTSSTSTPTGDKLQEIRKLQEDLRDKIQPDTDLKPYMDNGDEWYYEFMKPQAIVERLPVQNPDKFKKCRLHLEDAHRGFAIPLEEAPDDMDRIMLHGRRNCGRAFEGDHVVVEVIKRTSRDEPYSGRVIGVISSEVLPKNQLYLCRICVDQTSLMKPLCRTFPKIHVDNNPAKQYYEREILPGLHQSRESEKIRYNQGLTTERENNKFKESYADKIYVSLFKREATANDVNFTPIQRPLEVSPLSCDQVFVVCYKNWNPKFMYPYGVVVGVIEPADNIQEALPLLQVLWKVPLPSRKPQAAQAICRKGKKLDVGSRVDFRKKLTFTIDNDETRDMDDAFSVHEIEDRNIIEVGVHITDVTHFITKDSTLDKDARKRGRTFYPPKSLSTTQRPINMFPDSLAEDALSLKKDEDRFALSVVMYFTSDGSILSNDTKIKESVIRSDFCLDKAKALACLRENKNQTTPNLIGALSHLFRIAGALRKERLGSEAFVLQPRTADYSSVGETCEVEMMIEAFMVLANSTVAYWLSTKFPDKMLLRAQQPPNEACKQKLYQKFSSSFHMCSTLTRLVGRGPGRQSSGQPIEFSKQIKDQLKRDHNDENWMNAYKLLLSENLHPQISLALAEFYVISESAEYVVSGSVAEDKRGHHNLALPQYVQFTSPLRRYSDMVVHRLVKAALASRNAPYSVDELTLIATECTMIALNEKSYSRICHAVELSKQSLVLDGVIQSCSDSALDLTHPALGSLQKRNRRIDLARSGLMKIDDRSGSCDLVWKQRIYRLPRSENDVFLHEIRDKWILNSKIHHFGISCSSQEAGLLYSLRKDDTLLKDVAMLHDVNTTQSKMIAAKVRVICKALSPSKDPQSNTDDICWETNRSDPTDAAINFTLIAKPGNSVRVQLSHRRRQGLPQSCLQLVEWSPSFRQCMEHRTEPVSCFVKFASYPKELPDTYSSLSSYKERILPIVRMEAATEAIQDESAFVVHDVAVHWFRHAPNDKEETLGTFFLGDQWCVDRQIRFGQEEGALLGRADTVVHKAANRQTSSDLICVQIRNSSTDAVWIGHGEVIYVSKVKAHEWAAHDRTPAELKRFQNCRQVVFRLHNFSSALPRSGFGELATLEIVQKTVSSRRQEEALVNLEENDLATKIILGHYLQKHPCPELEDIVTEIDGFLRRTYKPRLNVNQYRAIRRAFREPISLIWGPPGTGKTWTGCLLTFSFCSLNRRRDAEASVGSVEGEEQVKKRQVLYCGPSNDCVNVVANELPHKFNDKCPSLLRVFGEQVEVKDFPVPGETSTFSRLSSEVQTPDSLKMISLHHLIRQDDRPHATEILQYDNKFQRFLNNTQMPNEELTLDDIRKYHTLISTAKREELTKYDVILCTTAVSASPLIQDACNFTQILIDEAGMCKEPETLIPLSCGKAARNCENIVLIGDHKQLRPIILDPTAAQLGLQISLFERYTKLRPDVVTMLNFQYRMHPSICEFPSMYFYRGRLVTQVSPGWAGLAYPEDMWKDQQGRVIPTRSDWTGLNPFEVGRSHYLVAMKFKESHISVLPPEDWPGHREVEHPFGCMPKAPIPHRGVEERIVFIHVVGTEETQAVASNLGNENSKANQEEVKEVTRIYMEMKKRFLSPRLAHNYVTVLTQYRLQVARISESLKDKGVSTPQVRTVIRSQGSENDYVIFSTVRSQPPQNIDPQPTPGWERKYLGFITDANQVNVALTRAKKGLIIIGNKNLLRVNEMWRHLIDNLEERNCVINGTFQFLP